MRLDLLLAREPFPTVLATTLSGYLGARTSWQGRVDWIEGGGGGPALRVHPKLNLIFSPTCPVAPLRELAAEYAYHPQTWRRVLQSAYVRYAVIRPLSGVLARARVQLEPFPEALAECCILGGNQALRIVDLVRDTSVVIRKRGYRRAFLDTAVGLRRAYPHLPGPRLLDWDLTQGWYLEERMRGLPLNRVSAPDRVAQALSAARGALVTLYEGTIRDESRADWMAERLGRIRAECQVLPSVYSPAVRREILALAETLVNRIGQGPEASAPIPTVISHGDFQPGNIIVPTQSDAGPVYVIDWEYAARRCCWYDAVVYALASRFPRDLANRVRDFWRDPSASAAALAWCGAGGGGQAALINRTLVFLLEDLLLRIEETAIPDLRQPGAGFLQFLKECRDLSGGLA